MRLELHPKQSEAFLTEATELLYGGAAGGGKSHLLRSAGLFFCAAIPGLQTYLFRRLSDDLRKNHMEGPHGIPNMAAELVDSGHAKINYSDGHIKLWNGSKLFLCHCQHEKDVYKYQGAEIHLLLIDELTHFTRFIYTYLRGRVRMSGIQIPPEYLGKFPRIICGSNPGGVGHNWVKAEFIDGAAPLEIRRMPKKEGGMLRQYIPARLDDNPSLADADPDYVDRLEGLGTPELVRAMKEGDWDIVAGGAFDDIWRRDKHVLPRFDIPSSWRLDRSFDWGSSKPFSVGWWAECDGTECEIAGQRRFFPRGTLIRVAEYYGWNGKPNEGCKMLAVDVAKEILRREQEMFPGRKVHPGPADSAIYAVENGNGIAQDMEKAGVRWEEADKRPGSRKTGFEAVRKRLAASTKSPMEEPGLFVTENCTHFIRTVPVLPRNERDMDDVDTNAEEHCVTGDTLVNTAFGLVPIHDLVGASGQVFTAGGRLQPFGDCRKTRRNAPVVTVTFENGEKVTCTPDHLFLTPRGVFVEAQTLRVGERVSALYPTKDRSSSGKPTTDVGTIFKERVSAFIAWCGNTTTARYQRGSIFITSMVTGAITRLRTLNWLRQSNTSGRGISTKGQFQKKLMMPQQNGTAAPRGTNGISSNIRKLKTRFSGGYRWFVHNVGKILNLLPEVSFAQIIARQHGVGCPVSMMSPGPVACVEGLSPATNITRSKRVQRDAEHNSQTLRVRSVDLAGHADVYCMNVENTHCFAVGESGIIIHNCYDETRYRVITKRYEVVSFKR